jgi:hypothetical protein
VCAEQLEALDFETEFTESNRETSTESEKIGDCAFYDTAGLNEPQTGIVPHSAAWIDNSCLLISFNLIYSLI